MKVTAELHAQDWIEMDTEDATAIQVIGCSSMLKLIREWKQKFGVNTSAWELPKGSSHAELLLKEALLKQRGLWAFPYPHQELCHCRAVPAEKVDQVILAGAHTPQKVSRLCSASTACGTCRPDVEKIIKYRLAG